MKNKDGLRILCAVIVTALAILILFSVSTSIQDMNKEKNEWEVFADRANTYTDHVLESGEFHKEGDTTYISWDVQSCSINGITVITDYEYRHSEYTYYPYTEPTYISDSEILTYGYVFADEDSLRIEWHSKSTYDRVYPSNPSQDQHVVNEDRVVRTQYIPYTSITTMTVNEVIE